MILMDTQYHTGKSFWNLSTSLHTLKGGFQNPNVNYLFNDSKHCFLIIALLNFMKHVYNSDGLMVLISSLTMKQENIVSPGTYWGNQLDGEQPRSELFIFVSEMAEVTRVICHG